MLMIPPALQTKSGAHRIPRSASAASSESSASWLLAAPAIALQRSAGTVSSLSTPPSAHGATMSTSAVIARERVRPLRAEALGQLALGLVDVGDDELRAALGQHLGQPAADAAEPDHRDAAAVEVLGAERPLGGHADRDLAAQRGPRARVAGARGEAGDVLGAGGDDLHVRLAGADVLGGQVVAAERVDGVAEVLQHGLPALGREHGLVGAQHDHALAAAERQPGDRGLEGHRARQPQHVADRGAGVVVGPHPAAARARGRAPSSGRRPS